MTDDVSRREYPKDIQAHKRKIHMLMRSEIEVPAAVNQGKPMMEKLKRGKEGVCHGVSEGAQT